MIQKRVVLPLGNLYGVVVEDGVPTISPRPLGYAKDYVRRPTWRIPAIGVGVLLCVAGSWLGGKVTQAKAQELLYARQASRHVEPASRVVFDADPQRAAELVGTADAYERLIVPGLEHIPVSNLPAVAPDPNSFGVLKETLGDMSGSIDGYGAMLFLHELTSASGARRIVAVRFLPWVVPANSPWRPDVPAGLIAYVFEPGGVMQAPMLVETSHAPLLLPDDSASARACISEPSMLDEIFDPYLVVAEAGVRWYAGQPDETNPAHFTLAFEVDGRPGTVDGFLSADGSIVRMNVRPRS